jgi:Flp pilus assembly protein TadG
MDRRADTYLHTFSAMRGRLAPATRRITSSLSAAVDTASALFRRFQRDQDGSFVIISALTMPVLIGMVGLGAEVTLWYNKHQTQQNAADSTAISAATNYWFNPEGNLSTQAAGVAAAYGYVNGQNGTTITVHRPPTSGNYTTKQTAVEVIVQQTQSRLFSKLWNNQPQSISARAVAYATGGNGCVLALSGSASKAIDVSGTADLLLTKCSLQSNSAASDALNVGGSSQVTALSVDAVGGVVGGGNITTDNGVHTGTDPATDPYANVAMPAPPAGNCVNLANGAIPQPNTFYCKLDFHNASDNITLAPGTYFIGSGDMKVNSGATVTGTGVTLVFTKSTSQYGKIDIEGGTLNLTAPTTGPTAGIAVFGDRNAPSSIDFTFNGNSTMNITGAIYVPTGTVNYSGGQYSPDSCLQVIGNKVNITGNSYFAVNCQGKGTKAIASSVAKLVE